MRVHQHGRQARWHSWNLKLFDNILKNERLYVQESELVTGTVTTTRVYEHFLLSISLGSIIRYIIILAS